MASEDESADLEALGLAIDDADEDEPAVLMQPCGALCGTRCGIYSGRPECCRTFECKVLRQLGSAAISAESAKTAIRELRERTDSLRALITSVGVRGSNALQEDYFEALELLSLRKDGDAQFLARRLRSTMDLVNRSIRKHFLDC